jgi:hypothetical protein
MYRIRRNITFLQLPAAHRPNASPLIPMGLRPALSAQYAVVRYVVRRISISLLADCGKKKVEGLCAEQK